MESETEQKLFKYLSLGLALFSLLILVKVVFLTPKPPQFEEMTVQKSVKIDFKVLENPDLEKLIPLERISLPEKVGRGNPFSPYGQ